MSRTPPTVGAVVIGRNEGERLRRCLGSLVDSVRSVVYVDSGSNDGSVEYAKSLGVSVVPLDLSRPFTAARARNAGFERLLELEPGSSFVQFVDGDCEVVSGWIERGVETLTARTDLGVVCGRRRERYPGATIYNRLCDMEWDTPVGSALACGGDALMRVEAFLRAGGFDPELIAGEEPELCVRIRAKGFGIERLDAEMTLHDADMTRFGQWWQRSVRAGHAFAEGAHLHGAPPERHWRKESRRALFWGGVLPAIATLGVPLSQGRSLMLLGVTR
jgi:glycosyltransferase involved in cell wall biosynthesis